MRNPFAWCFGRGKKGRRKKRGEREREEPTADEPRLRYPLYDPRRTAVDAGGLPRTASDHSSSPSVPEELGPNEQIKLPKDEEEEEAPLRVEEKEKERPEKVPQEKSPSHSPPPPSTPPPPPAPPTPSPETPKEKSPKKIKEPEPPKQEPPPPPPPKPPSPEPPKEEPPPPALSPPEPSPSRPTIPAGPPSTAPAPGPPSTAPEPAASVQPPSSPRGAVEAPPPDLRAPSSSQLADTPQMRKEAAMSPLEKLASARMGAGPEEALEEAEAATAPCTPPPWERGPVGAETKMQQLERTRQLQQKLLALEENLGEGEVRLGHDSGRRRRQTRREYPRYRVRWRCVQAAIDFYADAQDGILEDFRMRLDAHPPRTCRICKNFDFSDIPVLQ